MKFTATQVNQLIIELGYSPYPLLAKYQLETDFSSEAITTVTQLLQTLGEIDAKLTAALGKSRILGADGIQLDPGGNIRHLKSEGSRILGTISAMVGASVIHDKYRPVNRTSVRSYW